MPHTELERKASFRGSSSNTLLLMWRLLQFRIMNVVVWMMDGWDSSLYAAPPACSFALPTLKLVEQPLDNWRILDLNATFPYRQIDYICDLIAVAHDLLSACFLLFFSWEIEMTQLIPKNPKNISNHDPIIFSYLLCFWLWSTIIFLKNHH